MRSWIIFGVIVLLSGAGIWWWISDISGEKKVRPELVLHVQDTSCIASVKILDREGQQIHLYKEGRYWYLNDHIPARRHAVSNLLKTLHDQRVSALIPSAAKDNVIRDLSSNSVRISLEDRQGKNMMTFYVGGVTPDERGTFMLREGSEWPVIAGVPGFEGALRSRYIMAEREWQSRKLLPSLRDFQEIELDYPTDQEHSLMLNREGNRYSVSPLYGTDSSSQVNRYVAEAYLELLDDLQAEAVLDPVRIPQMQNSMPFCQILITAADEEVHELRFYPVTWIDRPGEDERNFIERYYTVVDGERLYLTQHVLMEKVFLSYSHFVSVNKELR